MKTLLLFRHAKSDWDADYGHDHDRPLNKRGRNAADQMGRMLAEFGELPDRIITSSAVRARTTLDRAVEAGGWSVPIRETEDLYHTYSSDVIELIREEPDETTRLMLVGHEPTWSSCISRFIGGGSVQFPTAAMARIDFDIDRWRNVAFKEGKLIWLVPPKLFT